MNRSFVHSLCLTAAFAAATLPPLAAQTMSVGQNLDAVSYHSTVPAFANSMKMAKPWMTRSAGGTEWESGYGDDGTNQIPKRSDGYPQYVPFSVNGVNQWAHTMIPIYENGSHRIVINGTGTVSVSGPGIGTTDHVISGSKDFTVSISGTNSLSAFDGSGLPQRNEPSHLYLVIKQSSSSNPIQGIRIMRPGQHTASKDAFDPSLVANLQPYAVIRFMDWQRTNNQTRTTWSIPENSKDYYTQATGRGVALEHCIDLANQLGKHLWLCVPHALNDSGITSMADFVAARVPSGRLVYLEYSNEHWNNLFSINTQWLPNASYAGSNIYQKYGSRAKFIFDTFKQRFDAVGKGSQLRRTLAGQAVNPWILEQALSMASSSTDVLAIAPYFGTTITTAPNPIPSLDALATETWVKMGEVRSGVDGHRTLAQNQGKTLVCYEGGQHYVGAFGQENNNPLTTRLLEFNRDWRMRNLYRNSYLGELSSRNVALFANFSLGSRWSKWGSWGNIEYWGQPIGQNAGDSQREWALRDWLANGGGGGTPPPTGGTTNLALNKPATASSTESGKTPAMANDGSTGSRWAAANGNFPHWWEVDLGSAQNVASSEIVFEGSSAWKYRIEGRATTTDAWTTLVDRTGNGSSAQTFADTLANGSNKRYIRVTVTGYNGGYFWASMWECRIFGSAGTSGGTAASLETYDPAAAKSSDLHRLFSESTASGGSCAVLEANAIGDFVTYAIPNVQAGTYTIQVRMKRSTNRAVFQTATSDSLGGTYTNRGSTLDGYNTAMDYVEVPAGTVTFGSAGTKYIRFTATGKQAASSGYWMAIDRIRLVP